MLDWMLNPLKLMSNHPNRSKTGSPSRNPSPEEIRAARKEAELTQTAAGALLYTTCRVWQQWEAGDRRMHPAFWELFNLKSADC
jgi:DNA-binding transcriptional regulator YiaG